MPGVTVPASVLIVRSGEEWCAFDASRVIETFRPLPVQAVTGAPPFVLGLARIRGSAVPVVDLAQVMEQGEDLPPSRFVSLRVEGRCVAVAVQEVLGVRALGSESWERLPPLLNQNHGAARAIGKLDAAFFLVLESARLMPGGAGTMGAEDAAGHASREAAR